MRVLHITTFLQGGAGRNIADLAVAQKRSGHDVRVVADAGGEPGYASYPEYLDELRAADISVLPVTSTFKREIALNTRAAVDLRRATRNWHPDIVHAHATTPAVVARLAGFGASQMLNTMHGWGLSKTPGQAQADIAVLELAEVVVVPSTAAARALSQAGLSRSDVQVIPYGIASESPLQPPDDADVDAVRRLAAGRPIAVCIGTIGERKNQRLLVDALALAPCREVVGVFIGDGDGAGLEAYARVRGVADRVAVLGRRAHASRYLPLADVLVLPSRNEGLPLAVLESFRAGVPVVAADIPEISEALDDGRYGHLFAPGVAQALLVALRAALGSRGGAGAALRQRFLDLYSAERMLQAYAALYERLAA